MFRYCDGNKVRWCCVAALVVPVLCADVEVIAGQNSFSEESVSRGVTYTIAPDQLLQQNDPFGRGVAFVDLDNDDDVDLVALGRADGVVGVFENDGLGNFTDRSASVAIPVSADYSGVTAADYDADGDLDLFFSVFLGNNVLMRNDGAFQFVDQSVASGLNGPGAGMGCAWGDVNGDGWVDLFVPNRTGALGDTNPNLMYLNNQDGTFTQVGETLGVTQGMDPSLIVAFVDIDRDRDADLYLGNDKGSGPTWQNHLFENQGDGTFVEITDETNTAAEVDCMGIAISDLTHNGWQDIYLTNIFTGNLLLLNPGNGPFIDFSESGGVESFAIGWSTFFIDFDNDTWDELYVTNTLAANRLYNYDNSWPATQIAVPMGVADPANSYCSAFADIDGDGDQDIVVSSAGSNLRLLINNEGETRNWIRLRIGGTWPNTYAVGTQVELCIDGDCQMREIFNGSNYKSQNEFVVHFGLGDATQADQILIVWPDGANLRLFDVPANSVYEIASPGPPPVPTMSEWGGVVLTLLLLTAGTRVFRGGWRRAYPSVAYQNRR